MKYACKSDIGKRSRNEDAFRIPAEAEPVPLLAVADGMGGHAAGAVASRLVIGGLNEVLPSLPYSDPVDFLRRAVQAVNLDVYRAAQDDPRLLGMGSTLVCALLYPDKFYAANVGDSRLYRFDGEALFRITTDHSLVEMLVQEGQITPEEAWHHPKRNLITRAMGPAEHVEPDIFEESWKAGDMLLLCSDGLSGSVSPEQLRRVLASPDSPEEKCDALVQLALDEGATDNITVVLALHEGGGV